MNVRRAVGEAIVAAQAVRAQRYMLYYICSFCRGRSHPKFSYLRKSLCMALLIFHFLTSTYLS